MGKTEKFFQVRAKVLDLLNNLYEECSSNENFVTLLEGLQQTKNEIEADKFLVAVVGVIKRGKSTLLNALLRSEVDILSTQVTPETARLAFLKYDRYPHATIYTKEKTQIDISIDELPEYTSAFDTVNPRGVKKKVENTLYADIFYPNEILEKGFCIIDTPGVDDPDQTRSDVTLNFIDRADAVIFLIDPTEGGFKDSEMKFLQSKILNNHGTGKGIICVANKIGGLRRRQFSNELPKLLENNEIMLKKQFRLNTKIFPIDAYYELCKIREEKNCLTDNDRNYIDKINNTLEILNLSPDHFSNLFKEFKNALETYLINEKGKLFLRRRIDSFLIQHINPFISDFENRISFEPKSIKNIEDKVKEVETQINILSNKLNKILAKFNSYKMDLNVFIKQKTLMEFNASINISQQAVEHLSSDIIELTERLSRIVSNKTQEFINDLVDEIKGENIQIARPDFNIRIKSIDASKYFTKTIENIEAKSDRDTIGAVVGGFLGFFIGGPLGIAVGAATGRSIGKGFNTTSQSIDHITFDEIGLKKEIEIIKQQLITDFQNSLNYYFNDISENVENIIKGKRKKLTDYSLTQKKNLQSKIFNLSTYRNEIILILNTLKKYKELFTKILIEVEKI